MPPILKPEAYHLGIDPGQSGAASLLDKNGKTALVGGGYDWFIRFDNTEHDVANWFKEVLSPLAKDGVVKAVIESVHAMPKQGVSSSFTFGRSYGFLRGMLVGYGIPFQEVTPQKWQKAIGCLSRGDKNVTKAKAQQLWPYCAKSITHKNADSLLIAEYGRRFCSA